MEFAIRCTREHHPGLADPHLGAGHLQAFYESPRLRGRFGRYLEDGIAHLEMLLEPR